MSRGQVEITTKRDPADTLTAVAVIMAYVCQPMATSTRSVFGGAALTARLYDGLARVCSSPLPVFP